VSGKFSENSQHPEAYRIGVAYRFAKQNNKNLATAAAPNAQGLFEFEENFSDFL
jgi:hypothetical protein